MDEALKKFAIQLLKQGAEVEDVAKRTNLSKGSIRALKAHIRMGTYGGSTRLSSEGFNREQKSLLYNPKDGYFLGRAPESGEKVFWHPFSEYTANPHIMIIGESGYGKSYATQCIYLEFRKASVGSIAIDFSKSMSRIQCEDSFLRHAAPVFIDAGTDGIPLNPLKIDSNDGTGPLNIAVRIADTFAAIYRIGVQQHALLRDAVLEAYARKSITPSNTHSWHLRPPTLAAIPQILEEWSEDRTNLNCRLTSKLRSHISTFFMFETFRETPRQLAWRECFEHNRCTVFQLEKLENRTKAVVTEFLLWDLLHDSSYRLDRSPRFVLLDEAHHLSFKESSPSIRIIREGRKFGLAAIFASQQPEDFPQIVYSNTASKLIFQISDDNEKVARKVKKKCQGLGSAGETATHISRLPKGTAFFIEGNEAATIRIASLEDRL